MREHILQTTRLIQGSAINGIGHQGQEPEWIRDVPPILRWAGGKRQLVTKLIRFLPPDIQERRYHEPFLGAGSLFFRLNLSAARLADANEHLIETYRWVARDWKLVARYLREHLRKTSERHYYSVREAYNSSGFSAGQAARFIYLNKTCFNGIFRVNEQGQFNVPYGWKEPPALPSQELLRKVSDSLTNAELVAESFEDSLKTVARGDFVYLDPPYPPLNGTSYFTHYTKERFDKDDQERLAQEVNRLSDQGALIMMTNADTPLIREMYGRYEQASLPTIRSITCKAKRHTVRELLIRNYS